MNPSQQVCLIRHGETAWSRTLSSPLQRARQTAEFVGFNSVELDDNLMEWNYGAYDGKTRDESQKVVPGWSLWTQGAPEGEMLEESSRST